MTRWQIDQVSVCLLIFQEKIMMLGDTNCETVIDWLNNKAISCLSVDAIKFLIMVVKT